MGYQSDGDRVPWGKLVPDFPVSVPAVIPFAPDGDEVLAEASLDSVARTLRVCPRIQLAVQGKASESEGAELADRRARAVCRALERGLAPQTTRDPRTNQAVPRLVPEAQVDPGAPRVEFEVTVGRLRTADGLRMRVTKVLLPRVRAQLLGAPGEGAR